MLAQLLSATQIGVFLAAALVLALTPGPGIMYVMARTLSGGASDGIASTLGTAVGGLVHVAVAAAGLSALLAASAKAFLVVKYVGAIYLVFLGVRSILSARRASSIPSIRPHGAPRAFLEGILTEALNVKTALFFSGIYTAVRKSCVTHGTSICSPRCALCVPQYGGGFSGCATCLPLVRVFQELTKTSAVYVLWLWQCAGRPRYLCGPVR